ncbi:MAG TPA: nucleotidyltransferase domain-containing protein [Thermoplasmata archaeon]|jgi:predicted nucleotidyltransferase
MNNSPRPARRRGLAYPTSNLLRHPQFLQTILGNPRREFTIREAALESGTAYSTAWRLAGILRDLGVLKERRVGASRAVSLNPTSSLAPELRRLLALELDPHREAARRFARLVSRLRGVRRVILFGSVARGTALPSSDVDVAVVMHRRSSELLTALDHAAARVQDETGLKVVAIPVTDRELGRDTRLARDVRSGEVLDGRP